MQFVTLYIAKMLLVEYPYGLFNRFSFNPNL